MRFTVLILLVLCGLVVGGGVFLATANIAPPEKTIEIQLTPQETSGQSLLYHYTSRKAYA